MFFLLGKRKTYITHNCVQGNCDMFPIEVKALVVELYKYFHIYTISVSLRAPRVVKTVK
jgi:hypothetical protein